MSEYYGVVKTNAYDGHQSVTLLAVGKTKSGLILKWNKSQNINGNEPKEYISLKFSATHNTIEYMDYNRDIVIRLMPITFPFIEKDYYVYRDILGKIKGE